MRPFTASLTTLALVLAATGAAAFDFAGETDEGIRRAAARAFAARAKALAPSATTAHSALEAVRDIAALRVEAIEALAGVRSIRQVEGILLADAIDDSLVHHMLPIFETYMNANPEPVLNAGTEKFDVALGKLGFISTQATGFLVHLDMQQALILLSEFDARRSEEEVRGAEDHFLRHYGELAQLHRVQHVTFEDLHACNVMNMEWVIGRLQSEDGVEDFMIANQLFAQRAEGFGFRLELVSQSTGEQMSIFYPLPWLTQMDEGWQKLQAEKKAAESGAGTSDAP